jgi:hypothetical protein
MTRQPDPVFDEWVAEARAASFERALALCGFQPARGKGKPPEVAGPCPACGGRDRFAVNFTKRKFNCRGCGAKGGDALALALVGERLAFVDACEDLSGRARPARIGAESAEEREARAARRAALDARQQAEREKADADAAEFRRREREAALRIWKEGRPVSKGLAGRYLAARGLMLPGTAQLRETDSALYFHGLEDDGRGGQRPRLIHRGPAMLALLTGNDGSGVGVHITWLSEDRLAKAALTDPETGEALPAKKMRGSKNATRIVLREVCFPRDAAGKDSMSPQPGVAGPLRLFIGEGIETTLSVATALRAAGRLEPGDAFWAAADLGNLGGPASGTVAHPTLTTPSGRPARVPGLVPDLTREAMTIPASVARLVLLGDGDSDPFTTRAALERARRRHAAPGRTISIIVAPQGRDFNDVLRGE